MFFERIIEPEYKRNGQKEKHLKKYGFLFEKNRDFYILTLNKTLTQ